MGKWRLKAVILSATTFIAFTGTVTGTLAWYAYATRASLSLGGTSVFSTEQLQMGLKTDKTVELEDLSSYSLKKTIDGNRYYSLKEDLDSTFTELIETNSSFYWFSDPGTGLDTKDISNYLTKVSTTNSLYTNTLIPVTTREYSKGSSFQLYRSPTRGEDFRGECEEYSYSKISFVFRVVTTSGAYVKNQGIWLVDAKESVSSSAGNALRLYFEGERSVETEDGFSVEESKVLFNPNAKKDGTIAVAGLLDLDNDGYYDYDEIDYGSNTGREYIYGLGNAGQPDSQPVTFIKDVDGKESDINNYYPSLSSDEERMSNTFYAKHKAGNRGYENFDSLTIPMQEYQGQESVYPNDKAGVLTGGSVLTSTSNDSLAVASLDMTLFLEGWDHSVIDKNIDYQFQLGLTFQINKVDNQYEA